MGQVYLAKKTGEGGVEVTCVVKTILAAHAAEEPFVGMFLREARILSSLRHQNIVPLFDCSRVDGTLYLAMEYVEGHDLRDVLRQAEESGRPMPLAVALRIASEALNGLAYAHSYVAADGRPLNIVHRDLTPTNILLSREGAVKLVDFGIAKDAMSENYTDTGIIKGKLHYLSPEQFEGRPLDCRVDVFAMGVVLYEMATGRKPFDAEPTAALIAQVLRGDYPPASAVAGAPAELDRLLARALAKKPEDRFASAGAMLANLEKLALRLGPLPISGLRDYYRALFETTPLPPLAGDDVPASAAQTAPVLKPAPSTAGPTGQASRPWSFASPAKSVTRDKSDGAATLPHTDPTVPLSPTHRNVLSGRDGASGAVRPKTRAFWLSAGALLIVLLIAGAVLLNKRSPSGSPVGSQPTVKKAQAAYRMVRVPGGSFTMGCSPGDSECDPDERPTHPVRVNAFWMDAMAVTQAQFEGAMGSNPSHFTGCPNCPVERVTWDEARSYCAKAGGRLPTEAEREFAARGGMTGPQYGPVDTVAWHAKNSGETTHPVGQKQPNAYALYDMLGNVWEWCADWYDEKYYAKSPAENPQGASSGTLRTFRGGSWFTAPGTVRATARNGDYPIFRKFDVGFRCVRDKN